MNKRAILNICFFFLQMYRTVKGTDRSCVAGKGLTHIAYGVDHNVLVHSRPSIQGLVTNSAKLLACTVVDYYTCILKIMQFDLDKSYLRFKIKFIENNIKQLADSKDIHCKKYFYNKYITTLI